MLKDRITERRSARLRTPCPRPDGSLWQGRISGQAIFERNCRFIGYRGLGVEVCDDR